VGAPAVIAQPERLFEERTDGAGLVESVIGQRGATGLGGPGEIWEDVSGVEWI
jgi:hypothetical protein